MKPNYLIKVGPSNLTGGRVPRAGLRVRGQLFLICSHSQESRGPEQTHVGPVLAASMAVSSYAFCLIDLEGLVLLCPSGSYNHSASSAMGIHELWGQEFDGDLWFRLSLQNVWLWVSASAPTCSQQKPLWWWLGKPLESSPLYSSVFSQGRYSSGYWKINMCTNLATKLLSYNLPHLQNILGHWWHRMGGSS